MRTTLNLPDGLIRAAKARAQEQGRTLTSVIEESLRAALASSPPREEFDLPVSGAPEDAPLVDLDDRDALEDAMADQ